MGFCIANITPDEMDTLLTTGSVVIQFFEWQELTDCVWCLAKLSTGKTCDVVSDLLPGNSVRLTKVDEQISVGLVGHMRILTSHGVVIARPEKGRAVVRTWPSREEAAAFAKDELEGRCGLRRAYKPFAHEGGFGLACR